MGDGPTPVEATIAEALLWAPWLPRDLPAGVLAGTVCTIAEVLEQRGLTSPPPAPELGREDQRWMWMALRFLLGLQEVQGFDGELRPFYHATNALMMELSRLERVSIDEIRARLNG